ncbi:MAG: hypothetical protein A2Y62_05685 [Candidatus Fischerbacteria bacterium RBG_13_37_8]|uniref:Biopolymer transporter ExbD n=1 Tax=Candidatus Fischerbacteria bacterium RBG_13_37_8 TaxID=1817863 RepID=A0A1F5VXU3_9BACT|nr:MAG: hypothetical protein A2Y62_05685 [Candidatus Fischerbacteria bacterium RBG_13_37_8]
MKLALRKKLGSEIPTASMADIAFLLIIFFMITGIFALTKGPSFAPPKEDDALMIKPEEAIYIHLSSEGGISVDQKPMELNQIKNYISSKLAQNPTEPVIIDTHPECVYGRMVDVFDVLKQLKVKNISIPSRQDRENWALFGIEFGYQ